MKISEKSRRLREYDFRNNKRIYPVYNAILHYEDYRLLMEEQESHMALQVGDDRKFFENIRLFRTADIPIGQIKFFVIQEQEDEDKL